MRPKVRAAIIIIFYSLFLAGITVYFINLIQEITVVEVDLNGLEKLYEESKITEEEYWVGKKIILEKNTTLLYWPKRGLLTTRGKIPIEGSAVVELSNGTYKVFYYKKLLKGNTTVLIKPPSSNFEFKYCLYGEHDRGRCGKGGYVVISGKKYPATLENVTIKVNLENVREYSKLLEKYKRGYGNSFPYFFASNARNLIPVNHTDSAEVTIDVFDKNGELRSQTFHRGIETVILNGNGVCFDFSVFSALLLRELGYKTYVIVYPTIDPYVYHAILGVKLNWSEVPETYRKYVANFTFENLTMSVLLIDPQGADINGAFYAFSDCTESFCAAENATVRLYNILASN